MMKLNKKFALSLILITAISALTGCSFGGKEEETPEVVYELTPLTADQLEQGKIYVKDGDKFFECPMGTSTFSVEDDSYVDEVDESRVIMFGKDDALIPTLYKDQQLVYITKVNPTKVYWERYEDEGYTVGVCGLTQSSTGKFTVPIEGIYFLEGSTLKDAIKQESSLSIEDEIIFNKISSVKIEAPNISRAGSILGLTKDQAYSVDIYKGSDYYPVTNIIADTHVFCNFEVQESNSFEYIETDYLVVNVPETIMSGYYYLNGLGFFRYVNGSAADGDDGINFNTPYYYTDEDGEVITYDDIAQTIDPDGEDVVIDENAPDHTNTVYVDCSNKKMTVSVSYASLTAIVNGTETNIVNDAKDVPTAKLTAPNGKEYDFLLDQDTSTLTCEVPNPLSGEWVTSVYNADNRRISFFTEFTSGHSDTLYHEGSGAQNMTYYLSEHMSNGLFVITWENKSRAAIVTITTPDGSEFSQEETPEVVFKDGYGFVQFELGELNYGDYTIEIEGDDLGRVRVQSEDLALSDGVPTIQVETEQ